MKEMLGGGWIDKLPYDVAKQVRLKMQVRCYSAGEPVFLQGDKAETLFEIVTGQVKIIHNSDNGNETLITIHSEGDCLGELDALDECPRSVNAIANSQSTLRFMDRSTLVELQKIYPVISEHLLKMLTNRLRNIMTALSDMYHLPLRMRILKRIYVLGKIFGKQEFGEVTLNIRLSQVDLGMWAGSTRQSINLELKALEREGLIRLKSRGFTIVNMGFLDDLFQCEIEK